MTSMTNDISSVVGGVTSQGTESHATSSDIELWSGILASVFGTPSTDPSNNNQEDSAARDHNPANSAAPSGLNGLMSDSITQMLLIFQEALSNLSTPSADTANELDTEANTTTASSTNEPTVRTINGHDVIVSGHSLDAQEGVSRGFTIDSSSAVQNLQDFADTHEVTGGLECVSTTPATSIPEGAGAMYVSATYFNTEGNYAGLQTSSLNRDGTLNTSRHTNENRQMVSNYMDIVDMEKQLKQDYGSDIKLAYSYEDQSYIMLTPDDPHYDEITSATQGVDDLLADIRKGHIPNEQVADILRQHGYFA